MEKVPDTHDKAPSPDGSTIEKYNDTNQIENAPLFPNLAPEDARWLADFPEDKKKKAIRKVLLTELGE